MVLHQGRQPGHQPDGLVVAQFTLQPHPEGALPGLIPHIHGNGCPLFVQNKTVYGLYTVLF